MDNLSHDIERYRKGEMTPEEMHALEKKALSDPFLADALDGALSLEPAAFSEDVASLNRAVHEGAKRTKTTLFSPLRIAAGVAFIIGAAALYFLLDPVDEPPMLSKTESPAPQSPLLKEDSIAAKVQSSASNNEPTQDELSEDVTKSKSRKQKDASVTTSPAIVPQEDASQPTVYSESESDSRQIAKVTTTADTTRIAEALQGQAAGVSNVSSQRITGRVTSSEDGLPLPGVNVMIKGTAQGTTTDLNGNFSLELPERASLVFSFVGLETVEAGQPTNGTLNVNMKEDVSQLSEVVVTRSALPKPETEGPIVRLAEPIGGIKAYNRYLEDNLHYPQQALDNNVKGRVVVEFSVGEDGKLDNFVIMRGLGYGCDDEVIRLVKEGPGWIPSSEDNQPVETSVRVRMRFDPVKARKKK